RWTHRAAPGGGLARMASRTRVGGAHNRLKASREKEMSTLDSTHARKVNERGLGAWMRGNLTTQGYCLSDDERRRLSLGLRFSTGTCLLLVIAALALESPAMIFALSGVGLIAGFARRHPFDLVWNYGVRHLTGGGPAL